MNYYHITFHTLRIHIRIQCLQDGESPFIEFIASTFYNMFKYFEGMRINKIETKTLNIRIIGKHVICTKFCFEE